MWDFVVKLILRNRIINLSVIALITIFMGYKAREVKLTYEFIQMLPKKNKTFVTYAQFKQQFGEDGSVTILGTDNKKLLELENFNKWYDLSEQISNIKYVDTVLSLAKVYNLTENPEDETLKLKPVIKHKPQSQKELDSLLDIIFNLPFYDNLLYIKNDSVFTTLMAITLNRKIIHTKIRLKIVEELYQKAEEFSAETGIDVHYSG